MLADVVLIGLFDGVGAAGALAGTVSAIVEYLLTTHIKYDSLCRASEMENRKLQNSKFCEESSMIMCLSGNSFGEVSYRYNSTDREGGQDQSRQCLSCLY